MNLRDMLEQKRRELSYGGYEYTTENMGDITGDNDDNYNDDYSDYNAYLGLDQQDVLDIELEASLIDDPDRYIDEATEEFNNNAVALAGELYMDQLIVEEALFECTDIRELEIVEESIKDTIKEKADKAINYIKELWKKFKAWIKNLVQVIINMFTSGAKLVEKYKSTIIANHEKRGSQIKVKCYKYKLDETTAKKTVEDIVTHVEKTAVAGSKLNMSDASKQTRQALDGGGDGQLDKEFMKKRAASCVREGDKTEYTLSQLNIQDIMDVCSNKKSAIKSIKECEKTADGKFKAAIDKIKQYKPDNADNKKSVSDNKDVIGSQVKYVKKMNAMVSTFVKSYVREVKAANRACAAICRKLLNQSTAGGDTETKLHKKMRDLRG